MSGELAPVDQASNSPTASGGMTAEEIDNALSSMARASAVLLQASEAARQHMDELDTLKEAELRQHGNARSSTYDPESVLVSVRLKVAVNTAKTHQDAAHEFVCWWVDAAIAAWRSTAHGAPLHRARMGAAAPETLMPDEDLALLPTVDDLTRQLVELCAFLGPPPVGEMSDQAQDPAAMAAGMAAHSGLRLRRDETGNVRVLDDAEPEARRRRLWGDYWIDHRLPRLPDPKELDLLLAPAPEGVAQRLQSATQAVIRVTRAGLRLSEMESNEAPWTPAEIAEYDRLSDQVSRVTTVLAEYARTVTDALPEMRAALT
ncbi:hypothetical protein [Streptomyces regalis]|uniref:Uncharacterized protein n=1 Tax=Streptomyces regalis TaxID=68262 RepID=A0A0X3UT39_9ACTN|nr:hypothetical protein [Streptomyces regalis]KUL34046.1 hypothetical protein ADL12_21210 [Streptomyces regalis]